MEQFLLDTNIISELIKPAPNANMTSWLRQQDSESLYISVITIAEIMRGVARISESQKKSKLMSWVRKEIPKQFEGRILDFDHIAALLWGEMQGEGDRVGAPKPVMDTQIAAIAKRFGMTLVTRNEKDFCSLSIEVFNPFSIDGADT